MKQITRLKPYHLTDVMQQANVPDTTPVIDIIAALQHRYDTVYPSAVLNTPCTECSMIGYIKVTLHGKDIKVPCMSCKGYLLLHTTEAILPQVINPFTVGIISKILPADIVESMVYFTEVHTIADMIIALINSRTPTPIYDCPKCISTGWVNMGVVKTICSICVGMTKTVKQYVIINGVAVPAINKVALGDRSTKKPQNQIPA